MIRAFGVVLGVMLLPATGLGQGGSSGIEYQSVAAALKALQAKPGVTFARQEDWTLAKDTDGANWSFTPQSHYAHPAVGRRVLVQQEGSFFVVTSILCEASKAACDRLKSDYELLDQRMNEAIRKDIESRKK